MTTALGTRARPNANPILSMMRDDDIAHDPFGTAMSWLGSVCDVLYDADPNMVPHECGYSPGMGGPEVPNGSGEPEPYRITLHDLSWETGEVWYWLHADDGTTDADDLAYWSDPTFEARAQTLRQTARALSLYVDLCREAGRAY